MSDKHIVDYTVVGDTKDPIDGDPTNMDFYPLPLRVKELIDRGWQPYGDVFVLMTEDRGPIRQQAMVKYGQPTLQRPDPGVLTNRK